jgi:hypothetical protein
VVHFDKPFYVGGEVIRYKLYLPSELQGIDLSVHLVVVDPSGTPSREHFLSTGGRGRCSGYWQLPFDVRPGYYRFLFSADRTLGAPVLLLSTEVAVYGGLPGRETAASEAADAPVVRDTGLLVRARWAAIPEQRAEVKLFLEVTDIFGSPVQAEGSVSVTDAALCGVAVQGDAVLRTGAPLVRGVTDWLSGVYRRLEIRDLSGRAFVPDLVPVMDLETRELHFGRLAGADVLVQVPPFSGSRRFQVTGLPELPMRAAVRGENPLGSTRPLPITAGVVEYLDLSRQRRKIYRLFGQTEQEPCPGAAAVSATGWKPDQAIRVQDYERFPDLRTLFQELVWRVRFTTVDGRVEARMYRPDVRTDFPEPPMFLLDGKVTFDAALVAQIDPNRIKTIELLYDPRVLRKQFPGIGGGGVVRIESISGDLELDSAGEAGIFTLSGDPVTCPFPEALPASQEPMLGPVLLWEPSFSTDKSGSAVIAYRQSDSRGRFCAQVVVQAPDGRRGSTLVCVEVP